MIKNVVAPWGGGQRIALPQFNGTNPIARIAMVRLKSSLQYKKFSGSISCSAQAEYRAMALVTYELIWLKWLLKELQFEETMQMTLIYDNQAAWHTIQHTHL